MKLNTILGKVVNMKQYFQRTIIRLILMFEFLPAASLYVRGKLIHKNTVWHDFEEMIHQNIYQLFIYKSVLF